MKQRVYIAGGDPAVLNYNTQELSFSGETLTFWVKGLTHFDVNAFVFSDTEMGESTINLDLIVPTDTIPEFDRFWYVDFRGEKFYLSTLKPACVKNTESLQYTYTLIFKSERADLDRYEFANFVSASSTPQVVSYDFSLPLTVAQFVERMNINLEYYFGTGKWQMILDPLYMLNINTAIYDGTSTVTVSFSRQSLWAILTGLYDVFGMRWRISSENNIMTIRLGYVPTILNHTFEYGKDNGLVSIERVNPQTPVYTRLSGLGSDRNLPYRYFKEEAPDGNSYTNLIPYNKLQTVSYRLYVKGWNDRLGGQPKQSIAYAYDLGYTDAENGNNFNPVDYVVSEYAETIYGVRKGSVADTDIYPTLQQLTTNLNQVIDVEEVLSDNYEQTDASLNQIVANPVAKTIYQGDRELPTQWEIQTSQFETIEDFNKISFYVLFDVSSNADSTFEYSHQCSVEILIDGAPVDSYSFDVSSASGYNTSQKIEFDNLDVSVYTIRASSTFSQSSGSGVYCTQTITNVTRQPKDTYKDTFDIWIRNIWGTVYQDLAHSEETPEQYMHRVWDDLLVPNKDITVMFSSGNLAGDDYEFKIARPEGTTDYFIYYDTTKPDSHWRLSLLKSDANIDSSKLPLPNTTQNAQTGDKFFFINIEMPYNPYVYDAEQRLETFLQNELLKVNNENPTYAVEPSSIFLESYAENASIATGVVVPIADAQMCGAVPIELTISNLTIEYTADKMLPKWSITVAQKPTSVKNTIQIIQGDIKVLSSNLLSAQELTDRVQSALDGRYLQKNGTEQTSYSKTTFKDNLTLGGTVKSEEYLQGQIGGYGFSIDKDALGNYVLEIDKINVRKSLNINELVINQVSIYGGIHVYSAAAMTVSAVDSSNAAYHLCSLDIKNGTVLNQFVVGDHAYCKRFEPESGQLLKYYWKEVVAVGSDYIAIAKTGGDGSINQIPSVGDNIAQLGNTSDPARQSALIIDQTNGGTVTQYAGINNFSLANKDYIRYGVDPLTGRAYEYIYGDMYVGGRNPEFDSYLQFDSSAGRLKFRGTITQDSYVVDDDANLNPITVDRGVYTDGVQYYIGNTAYHLGSTYYCFSKPPINTPPTNTTYWRLHAAQGQAGSTGGNTATIYLYKRSVSTPSWDDITGFTYNFISRSITEGNIGSWSITIPSGTDPIWVVTAVVYSTESEIDVYSEDLNPPILFSDNGQDGDDAKLITLTASTQIIHESATGVRTPETITVTSEVQYTTITEWSFSVNGGAFSTLQPTGVTLSGDTVNISAALIDFITLSIKATDGVFSDTVTISRTVDGSSTILVDLSNQSHIIRCNSNGLPFTGELAAAKTLVDVYKGGDKLTLGTDWGFQGETVSEGISYNIIGNEVSVTAIDTSVNRGYIDLDIEIGANLVVTKRFSISKSKDGSTGESGDNAIQIYCESQNISVEPTINNFTKSIVIKLLSGGVAVPTALYSASKSLIGLYANIDTVYSDYYTINLTGFQNETTGVGYVNISIVYNGITYELSISVVRLGTPVMINGKDWMSGASYTGNYIQRSVVRYLGYWYSARTSAGTFTSTTNPLDDTTRWELLSNYTNVATDSLFANEANIAGFIYKNEQMISQSGTIAGNASTNWAHHDFLPNLILDGSTGAIDARAATVRGIVNAESGKIGGLTILGEALMSESMTFAEEAVESLTTLKTPVTYSVSYSSTWASAITGTTHAHAYTNNIVIGINSILRFRAAAEADPSIDGRGWKIYIRNSSNVIVYSSSGSGALATTLFQVPISGGTYTIHIETTGLLQIGQSYYNSATISGEASTPSVIYATGFLLKTKIGNNGLFSFWGENNYFYYSAATGLEVKGATNTPGILAACSVSASGVQDTNKAWGAKVSTGSVGLSASTYTVPHLIGHADFTVQLTSHVPTRIPFVIAKSSTTFTVMIKDHADVNQVSGFDYVLIGAN